MWDPEEVGDLRYGAIVEEWGPVRSEGSKEQWGSGGVRALVGSRGRRRDAGFL